MVTFRGNGCVACTPPASLALQKTGMTFVIAKQQSQLLEMKVVFGPDGTFPGAPLFSPGDLVWVEYADTANPSGYMQRQYDLVGLPKFVLVPLDQIRVHATP